MTFSIPFLFEVCIFPLITAITIFVIRWLNTKTKQLQDHIDSDLADKYIGLLNETVSKCVLATTQTYVDSLKKQGKFDETAQKAAFKQSYDAILTTLSDEAKVYLTNIYGDFETYLTQLVEAEVKKNK